MEIRKMWDQKQVPFFPSIPLLCPQILLNSLKLVLKVIKRTIKDDKKLCAMVSVSLLSVTKLILQFMAIQRYLFSCLSLLGTKYSQPAILINPYIYDCCFPFSFKATLLGFPGGSLGKESAHIAGDLGSIPGLGVSSGGGHGNPLQYSCLENTHGQRSLAGCSPTLRNLLFQCAVYLVIQLCPTLRQMTDLKESDTTEQLNTQHIEI